VTARVSLVLGGARSGKTARALALAAEPPHVYLATAAALDGEMADRIAAHKAERGASWGLIEAELDVVDAIRSVEPGTTVLVDCLTLWLSNLMHHGRDVAEETEILCETLHDAPTRVILVSNEIGMGLVPMEKLSRDFRDAQGRLNQRIAAVADHVEFVVAGLPMVVKGSGL
jgi:adenosylcobinamide kinase/adenosylcobinamide-phosphate guanylyltransferase